MLVILLGLPPRCTCSWTESNRLCESTGHGIIRKVTLRWGASRTPRSVQVLVEITSLR